MGCCRVTDMRHKEVVNCQSGCRMGYVDDVEVDTITAKVISIIIYGRPRCFGLFGRCEDMVISWNCIELIGEDTILVNHCPVQKRSKKKRFHLPVFGIR